MRILLHKPEGDKKAQKESHRNLAVALSKIKRSKFARLWDLCFKEGTVTAAPPDKERARAYVGIGKTPHMRYHTLQYISKPVP
jgi:hypothetical protein